MKRHLKMALLVPVALTGLTLAAQDAQKPPAEGQTQQDVQQQTTTGKIAKANDKYVLVDSSGTMYQLDDQDTAKKFDGKKVKVSGTIDTTSNTIHVSDIRPA